MGSAVDLHGLAIRKTVAQQADGLFGDNLAIVNQLGPTSAVVTHSEVVEGARAGLGNFGAHVALGASSLSCNALDLAGEDHLGQPFVFDDVGANGCGCPEPTDDCKAISTGLAPPQPVEDAP